MIYSRQKPFVHPYDPACEFSCPSCEHRRVDLYQHDIEHDRRGPWFYLRCAACGYGTSYRRTAAETVSELSRTIRVARKAMRGIFPGRIT